MTAENARATAETARANSETTRDSSETTRKNQETTRQKQEAARVEAEKKRVSAENGRATAESGRVKAETKRETDTKAAIASSKTQTDLAKEMNDHPPKWEATETGGNGTSPSMNMSIRVSLPEAVLCIRHSASIATSFL